MIVTSDAKGMVRISFFTRRGQSKCHLDSSSLQKMTKVQQTVWQLQHFAVPCLCSDAISFARMCVGSCTAICWGARGREKSATGGEWTAVSHAGGKLEFSPLSIYTTVIVNVICFVVSESIYWPVECESFGTYHALCQGWKVSTISGLNCGLNCPGRNRFLSDFVRFFLPKHNKCSNIIDKSTPSLFLQNRLKLDTIC